MNESPAYPTTRAASLRLVMFLLVTGSGFISDIDASAAEVWVITDSKHPIQLTPGARLIELDAPARIKGELSAKLSSDPAQASLVVQQRLKSGGTDLQERLAKAYQGVIDAWTLDVTKIPAVIFDRRYVIYGETNTARAVARIEEHRRRTGR